MRFVARLSVVKNMYNYMIGKIATMHENTLVIEVGGIGYEIFIGSRGLSQVGQIGETVKIYTFLNVREDEMSLFGFCEIKEKELFLKLLNVSGIGPKVAISIMGSAKIDDIIKAIVMGNLTDLSKIKGIGKKTAERIVVELKDKLSVDFAQFPSDSTIGLMPVQDTNDDAVSALISLGYSKQEAVLAVIKVQKPDMSVEQIIMQALKGI